MKRRCEGVVIRVREDIVNPPVLVKVKSDAQRPSYGEHCHAYNAHLEEIFLDAKHKIENGISRVLVSVGLFHFLETFEFDCLSNKTFFTP